MVSGDGRYRCWVEYNNRARAGIRKGQVDAVLEWRQVAAPIFRGGDGGGAGNSANILVRYALGVFS